MLSLYDQYFFNQRFKQLFRDHGCEYSICWNRSCTTTAGYCRYLDGNKCKKVRIELGPKIFKRGIQHLNTEKEGP